MYVKLFSSIFDGTLRGRSDALLVWIRLLTRADKEGFVDCHFKEIADATGLPVDRVKAAIVELESPDPESRSQDLEGRRLERIDEHRAWGWRIINYVKYRELKSDDERRAYNAAAQARFRERQAGEKPSTQIPVETPPTALPKPKFPPAREELDLHAAKIGLPSSEVDKFVNYYESNGWRVGKNPMKSWAGALSNWKTHWQERKYGNSKNSHGSPARGHDRNAGTYNEGKGQQYADYVDRISKQREASIV